MLQFLEACVKGKLNIIVAGGTQVIPEEGVKTGIDAAFGRNSHGIDVASFLVEERQRRRKAKEEAEKADK
jgi:D-ornithine 4,5-aminomutase subunit beta